MRTAKLEPSTKSQKKSKYGETVGRKPPRSCGYLYAIDDCGSWSGRNLRKESRGEAPWLKTHKRSELNESRLNERRASPKRLRHVLGRGRS